MFSTEIRLRALHLACIVTRLIYHETCVRVNIQCFMFDVYEVYHGSKCPSYAVSIDV